MARTAILGMGGSFVRPILARGALAVFLAVSLASAVGASLIPSWQQPWPKLTSGAGVPVIGRELADGSTMVYASSGVAVRYDANGSVLSTATFTPPRLMPSTFGRSAVNVMAIDSSGEIFIAVATDTFYGDIWVMGFDGLTGAALWPSPMIVPGSANNGVIPDQLLVGPDGNPILFGHVVGIAPRTLVLKLDHSSGVPIWGQLSFVRERATGAVDPAGDIVALITNTDQGSSTFGYKIRGADGTFAWGPVLFTDGPDLQFDALGDFTLAGVDAGLGYSVSRFSGSTGARIWGPVTVGPATSVRQITLASNGNVISSERGPTEIRVAEYSGATGSLLWGPVTEPTGNTQGEPWTVRVAPNGDVVFVAWSTPDYSTWEQHSWKFSAANGNLLWGPKVLDALGSTFFRAPVLVVRSEDERIVSAAVTAAGDFVGFARDPATGDLVWGPTGFSANLELGRLVDIAQTPDGSVFATGVLPIGTGYRWTTLKYDRSTGTVLWGPVFFDAASSMPVHVRSDASGNAVVVGFDFPSHASVVRKYAGSDGSLSWSSTVANTDFPNVSVGPTGDIALSWMSTIDGGIASQKLSSVDGSTIWGPTAYGAPPGEYVVAAAVAFDPAGDVLVAGYTGGGSFSRWVTLKYSGASGALVWGPVFVGTSSASAYDIEDLVVDGGDFFVVGSAYVTDPLYVPSRVMTVKYSGATGSTIWGPILATIGQGFAGAVDSSGDLLVTGYGYSFSSVDFATIKYRGTDGSLLWGPTLFDGPAGAEDRAVSVATDGAGNAVVAGVSTNSWDSKDLVLIEYDGATGIPVGAPAVIGGWSGQGVLIHGLLVSGTSAVIGSAGDNPLVAAFEESPGVYCDPEFPPPVATITSGAACDGQSVQLSASSYPGATYSWTGPNGFTSTLREPTVLASAAAAGTYSVAIQAYGCALATATTQLVFHPALSSAITASLAGGAASVPDAGPGTTYQWSMSNGTITGGLGTRSIQFTTGPGGPSLLTVTVGSPSGCSATSVLALFSDVPSGSPMSPFISRLVADGVTAGCGPLQFCPNADVTRAQMAVFLLRSKNGRYYTPPSASGTLFADVPASSFAAAWIEALSAAGVSSGCGGGNYCPTASLSRAQMAVFLLRTLHGSSFTPPPATGTVFSDVPASAFAAAWIERLAAEGLTAGCGPGLFCPDASVSRAQMAVFLVQTFSLP